MSMSLAIPLVISAIKALLRFRHRVDTILSLNEATAGLPFRLPPAPHDAVPHLEPMIAFFATEQGQILLELNGLTPVFPSIKAAHANHTAFPPEALNPCFTLYFHAADIQPTQLSPEAEIQRQFAGSGPSVEMRLAYYVVESHRLSRNPALTRVLLTTADTLLEVAGESAGLFIANPRVRGIIEGLLHEFAVKHDFDDDSAERIFKRLLGVAATVALDHREQLSNAPAVKVLFAALSDVREELGNEFVAELISQEGFEYLVAAIGRHVARDPLFVPASPLAQEMLAATLREFGNHFPAIVAGDKEAVFSVLEAGLAIGAANVTTLLKANLAGNPLATAVLTELAAVVQQHAAENTFFKAVANGRILGELYRTSLAAVATHPTALGTATGLKQLVSGLVAEVARVLVTTPLADTLSPETFHAVLGHSLHVLAAHPEVVARQHKFAATMLGAVFDAEAPLVKNGLQGEDVLAILDATVKAATENVALVDMDERFRVIFTELGTAVTAEGMHSVLHAEGRRQVLISIVQALAVNPRVWCGFQEQALVQPLVIGLINGLTTDPTRLLSGSVMVDAFRQTLTVVARHGKVLLDKQVQPDVVQRVLTFALSAANAQIGLMIDRENLPDFLRRVVSAFLQAPFSLIDAEAPEFRALVRDTIASMQAR